MNYQDTWLNGHLVERGYRPCEDRYAFIRDFCRIHCTRGFSICDLGSNMAYFPIRLIEEFDAIAVAFEFHQYQRRQRIIRKQRTDHLMYINRKVSLSDLTIMSRTMQFDVLLGLSVLHHVTQGVAEWIVAMRALAKIVIVEMALSDSARTKKPGYEVPDGGTILGYGASHLQQDIQRPIIAFVNR